MRSICCWAILLIAVPGAMHAQSTDTVRAPLSFRRAYVPESELLERVKQGQRYVPMDTADFEVRLRRIQNNRPAAHEPAARIIYSRYTASLDSALRLTGRGAWHVRRTIKEPVVLPLPGLRFSLERPRWKTAEGDSSPPLAAAVGATEQGSPALYADRDGIVEFDWSLAGPPKADEILTYDLSLPPSPSHRIELTLPMGLVPAVDGEIVSEPQADGATKRRWTMDLVGKNTAQLRLLKNDGASAAQPLVIVKPRLTYELSSRGLQLSSECRLDIPSGTLKALQLDLEPTLAMVSAKLGDTPVAWSVVPGAEGDSQRIVVDFPEPLAGHNHVLRLVAVAPLSTKPGWRLPKVFPQDVVWQDGAMVLVVAAPLTLRQLDLMNCRQTKRETLPAPATGEAIEIQALAQGAAVQLHVAPTAERLELSSATTIEMLGNEAIATYTADITAHQGERFQLAAEVSPDWIIDAVQSFPADMIADWDLRRGSGTASRLIIHLSRTLNRDRPLRLSIAATRRRAPLGDTLEIEDLRLLDFENITAVRRLACLTTARPFRLDVRNAHRLTRLDSARLDPADGSLLEDVEQGLLFVMDEDASDVQIRLLPERPRFSASLQASAVVGDRELVESYRLRITPESNELDRVLVQFSQARRGDLTWSIDGDNVEQLLARRLSPAEQAAQGLGEIGETWEISLRPARTSPFVLTSQRATPLHGEMPISLPFIRNATSQQGGVVVELDSDFVPELQERRVTPLAVPPPAPGESQNTIAAYEYDPTEDLLVTKEPALTLKTDRVHAHRRRAWVWHCRLDAWYSASDQAHHRTTFAIENRGRSEVTIGVPAGALPSVKRDGIAADDVRWDQQARRLDVPLPAGRRFCLLQVTWNGGEASLGSISSPSLEWPTVDIPILGRRAAIWLPSSYILADNAANRLAAQPPSTSWRGRLFGVFGRPADRETFEPWYVEDWSRITGKPRDTTLAVDWSNRFIERTAHEVTSKGDADGTEPAEASWGDVLYNAWYRSGGDDSSPPVPLLIHWKSLEQAGVRSAATIDRTAATKGSGAPRIRDLFEQRGLVLLVSQQAALLTRRQWAATWYDRSIATSRDTVIDSPSGDFLTRPFISTDDAARHFVPLETWLALPDNFPGLWVPDETVNALQASHTGWVEYPLEWPASDRPLQLLIIHRQTLLASSIALLLLTAGVAWRLAARPIVIRLVALAVIVIAALLLPAAFATLGAAAVLGFLAGQSFRWLAPPVAVVRQVALAPQAAVAVASSLMLFSLSWSTPAPAQQSPAADQEESRQIYDVLIPIDRDEKVVGDKVFVPEPLYKALTSEAVAHPEEHQYLITRATYEGPGKAATNDNGSTASRNWKASLTVEPLQTPARVYLPLGSDGAQIVPDSGSINGRPLRFGWDEARKSITFDVTAKATAEIEFEFRPQQQNDASSRGVSFAIPNVPQARVRLPRGDSDLPRITALGGTSISPDAEYLIAEVGPLSHVSVTWNGAPRQAPSPQFESEELAWLKLRPGSATLNTRFTIQVRRGELHEASLLIDERLLPLPPLPESLVESIRRVSTGELRLRFKRPLTDASVFDLAFVVQGASGTGKFTWPNVELTGSQAARRYIAYTVDPTLEVSSQPPAEIKPLNAAQFAALWGDPEARPQAFELPVATARWEFEVRPRQASLTGRYQTIVEARADYAALVWNASLDISGGSRFQLRFAVPTDLVVERVEVRDAAGLRPARWALGSSDTLTVFLETAATGKLELALRGRVPADDDGRIAVPVLQIAGSSIEQAQMSIVRRSNVVVSIHERPDLGALDVAEGKAILAAAETSQPDRSPHQRARVVGAFDVRQATAPIVITVARNRARFEAVQAVTLSRPNDSWQAALDLEVRITDGMLDAVHIEMPASWTEPLRIDPAMPYEFVEVAGETRRQLVLYPPQPLTGEAHLRIEGPLAPLAGGRVRAPDARLIGAASLAEYFILPQQQELQTLAWETSGLKSEALPEALVPRSTAPDTVQTYLRVADMFRAELRSVERIAEDVQVRLADIAVNWSSDGSCYGVATFDVEPAGRTSCRLALPAGYQLVQASVDNRPLRIAPTGEQRWQVPLGGRLPQRIEVLFTGVWSTDVVTPAILEAPRLIGLPVERTLWTVSGPRWAGAATAANSDRASQAGLQVRRYETLAGMIDSAANTLLEMATDETPNWYSTWARRMVAARETLARLRLIGPATNWDPVAPGSAGGATSTTDLILQDQQRLAERLGTSEILEQLTTDAPLDESAATIFQASLGLPHGALGAVFLGEAPVIELSYASPYAGDLPWRIVQVLIAAVLLFLTVLLLRYTSAIRWLFERPRLVGIAFGLFWWLFLFPSALGWLIFFASIVAPYLGTLKPRRPRPLRWRWRA